MNFLRFFIVVLSITPSFSFAQCLPDDYFCMMRESISFFDFNLSIAVIVLATCLISVAILGAVIIVSWAFGNFENGLFQLKEKDTDSFSDTEEDFIFSSLSKNHGNRDNDA